MGHTAECLKCPARPHISRSLFCFALGNFGKFMSIMMGPSNTSPGKVLHIFHAKSDIKPMVSAGVSQWRGLTITALFPILVCSRRLPSMCMNNTRGCSYILINMSAYCLRTEDARSHIMLGSLMIYLPWRRLNSIDCHLRSRGCNHYTHYNGVDFLPEILLMLPSSCQVRESAARQITAHGLLLGNRALEVRYA